MKKILASVMFALALLSGGAFAARQASANGYWAYNIPSNAYSAMTELSQRNNTIKSVAFAPNGGWVVVYNRSNLRYEGIPSDLQSRLIDIQESDANVEIKSVAFAPNGGWVVLVNRNGFYAGGIDQTAFNNLSQLSRGGHELKSVAFAPNGGYVIISDTNGVITHHVSTGLVNRLTQLNSEERTIKSVSFGLNDSWAVVFDYNGIYLNAAQSLADRVSTVWAANQEMTSVSFVPSGGWALVLK